MTRQTDGSGRVKLADVAAEAGVSVATASRALADDPRISEPTKRAVLEAAERLAYVPNAAARGLALRRTRTLGLLLADLSDPVHGQVASGFEAEAAAHGYTVLIVAGFNEPEQETRALGVFVERGTDGIALVSSVIDPDEARERAAPAPIVVVQPDHPSVRRAGQPPAGVIQTDDVGGVEAAVRHLLDCGYRRIAYLGAGDRPSNLVRRTAAEAVVRAAGGERTLREVPLDPDAWRRPDLVGAAVAADLPDAVVCYDDKLALALLDGLRDHGVRVPEDVGVVGFDGIPFAAVSNPRLTTVLTPTAELGQLAARALVGAITTGERVEGVVLPVELAVRESTRDVEGPSGG